MVLGAEFFKSEKDFRAATVVPIAFPLIAGSGTLTTIISLKANYEQLTIFLAILFNLIIVYAVLKSLRFIERILGPAGLIAVRKFFWCNFDRYSCKNICYKCTWINKVNMQIIECADVQIIFFICTSSHIFICT
jgi:hypothetical protein